MRGGFGAQSQEVRHLIPEVVSRVVSLARSPVVFCKLAPLMDVPIRLRVDKEVRDAVQLI